MIVVIIIGVKRKNKKGLLNFIDIRPNIIVFEAKPKKYIKSANIIVTTKIQKCQNKIGMVL